MAIRKVVVFLYCVLFKWSVRAGIATPVSILPTGKCLFVRVKYPNSAAPQFHMPVDFVSSIFEVMAPCSCVWNFQYFVSMFGAYLVTCSVKIEVEVTWCNKYWGLLSDLSIVLKKQTEMIRSSFSCDINYFIFTRRTFSSQATMSSLITDRLFKFFFIIHWTFI